MQEVSQIQCGTGDFVELIRLVFGRNAALRFQAHGHSMHPTIRHGDVILVEPTNQVKVGDVAFFQTESGRAIAHRVMGKILKDGQCLLQTKGDACWWYDHPVSEEQLLGRVVSVDRTKGRKVKRLQLDKVPTRWMGFLWTWFPFSSYRVYRFLATFRRDLLRLLKSV